MLNDNLTAADHVSSPYRTSSFYALGVLCVHGLSASSLQDYSALPFSQTTRTVLLRGQAFARRLDAFLRHSKDGYRANDIPTSSELFAAADQSLFERVLRQQTPCTPAAAAGEDQ